MKVGPHMTSPNARRAIDWRRLGLCTFKPATSG